MNHLPLRLTPGTDLRRALEEALRAQGHSSGFVLSGIGSLADAKLRYAGMQAETGLAGPLEVLTLAGSISQDGAHLHMSVSTHTGQVFGGHVCYGNIVRTTAEVLVAVVPGWQLSREHDPATGYQELLVRPSPQGG